ncbi:uncharacterized protein LOC144024016 [Festucalex cinctus]
MTLACKMNRELRELLDQMDLFAPVHQSEYTRKSSSWEQEVREVLDQFKWFTPEELTERITQPEAEVIVISSDSEDSQELLPLLTTSPLHEIREEVHEDVSGGTSEEFVGNPPIGSESELETPSEEKAEFRDESPLDLVGPSVSQDGLNMCDVRVQMEPPYDNASLSPLTVTVTPQKKRKRKPWTRFTPLQFCVLEMHFHYQMYPAADKQAVLAKTLKMTDARVTSWFKNRRSKWRRQSAEKREADRQQANQIFMQLQQEAFYKTISQTCCACRTAFCSGCITRNLGL